MSSPISGEVLSIVREELSLGHTLPRNVVEAMTARIDHQNRIIRTYGVLVACHDNYLIEVDKTTGVSERLRRLDQAREIVAELEK